MEVESLISSKKSNLAETYTETSDRILKGSTISISMKNGEQDALEAVKLDPAVLEAQVTVHAKNQDKAANACRTPNDVIEKKKVLEKDPTPSQRFKSFEDMMTQHEAALLSLTPHQMDLLMKYVDFLRRQRMITQRHLECAFCKNNGKPSFWYKSHALRDTRGRVRCPVLRGFHCPRCGATGDRAHTIKYCPDNSFIDSQYYCSGI